MQVIASEFSGSIRILATTITLCGLWSLLASRLTFRKIDGPQHHDTLPWQIAGGYRGHRGEVNILEVWRCGQDRESGAWSECVNLTGQLDMLP